MTDGPTQRKVIWSGSSSPSKEIAREFGIRREDAKKALHDIKQWGGLDPDDGVVIYNDGDVETTRGELIGNIKDEAGV